MAAAGAVPPEQIGAGRASLSHLLSAATSTTPGPGRTAAESPRSCSCATRRRQAGRSSLRRGPRATAAGGYSRRGCVGRRLTTRAARALTSGERPSLPSPLHSLAFFPHPQVSPLFSFVMHFFLIPAGRMQSAVPGSGWEDFSRYVFFR